MLLCWPCWRRRLAPSASLSPSAAWPPRSGRFPAGAVLSARYCAVPKHTCVCGCLPSVRLGGCAATSVRARRGVFFQSPLLLMVSNERSTDLEVLSRLHANTDLWPLLLASHAPRRAAATGAWLRRPCACASRLLFLSVRRFRV